MATWQRRHSSSPFFHLLRSHDSPILDSNSNEPDRINANTPNEKNTNSNKHLMQNSKMSDDELLRKITKAELVSLCKKLSLNTEGTKLTLIQRMRNFAASQLEAQREEREGKYKQWEESGEYTPEEIEAIRAREESEEPVVYVSLSDTDESNDESSDAIDTLKEEVEQTDHQLMLTAPPPPTDPNERGVRAVTVYDSKDPNDMTGVAPSHPGAVDSLASTFTSSEDAPWDVNNAHKNEKLGATTEQLDAAKEEVTELIRILLSMSGAPAFRLDMEGDLSTFGMMKQFNMEGEAMKKFIGFDPSRVDPGLLVKASKSLRIDHGNVLHDTLREFEVRAVGFDGHAGDNKSNGGGHYLEVAKVRSFLEGFRKAEVRRIARETVTMLLNKIANEGINALDLVLATMTRNSDDTGEGGELNDSLLDYLDDVIRTQQKKVDQYLARANNSTEPVDTDGIPPPDDVDSALDKLWISETNDGEQIETFDPNKEENKKALKEAYERSQRSKPLKRPLPKSGPERLLLLLTLLRERLRIEAAFSHDERAHDLRVLAYCTKLDTDAERNELITKEFGSSLDVRMVDCQCAFVL